MSPGGLGRVMAEIIAHPADDAPRLVWADLIGGERGELVVVQCDLARGDLAPADRAARIARERELLDAHDVAWADPVPDFARHWQFRRGFVEAVALEPDAIGEVRRTPLVTAVTVGDDGELAEIPPQLRGMHVRSDQAARMPLGSFDHLRSLSIGPVQSTPSLKYTVQRGRIEQLWMPACELSPAGVDEIVAEARHLTALWVERASIDTIVRHPLRALRIDADTEQLVDLGTRMAPTLAYLADAGGVDWRRLVDLPGFANLVTIDTPDLRGLLETLADHPDAWPQLAAIHSETAFDGTLPRPIAVTRRMISELLYADPRAMGSTGEARYAKVPPFALIIANRTYQILEREVGRPIYVGGSDDCTVRVELPEYWLGQTVSLRWIAGRMVVRNTGPRIDGLRIEGDLRSEGDLVPGMTFSVGNVAVRYVAI